MDILLPLYVIQDIQIASVYDLCSNSDTTCITSDSSCIDSKSCENLIVIEADEDAGFAYHLLTTGHQYVSLGFSHDKSMVKLFLNHWFYKTIKFLGH